MKFYNMEFPTKPNRLFSLTHSSITMTLVLGASLMLTSACDSQSGNTSASASAAKSAEAEPGDDPRVTYQDSDEEGIVKELVVKSNLPEEDGLPIFGTVADFTFTERGGKPLSPDDLKDKVWVASFIFTRCAGPCPTMSEQMSNVQSVYDGHEDVRLVSFTVDPDYDTPRVLDQYGERYDANPDTWLFLQGTYESTQDLAINSFMVGVDREGAYVDQEGNVYDDDGNVVDKIEVTTKKEEADPDAEEGVEKKFVSTSIIHSTKFILVDQLGRIRGYYEGIERDATKRLVLDVQKLLDNPPKQAAAVTQPSGDASGAATQPLEG
jgi:protein SCO1/2